MLLVEVWSYPYHAVVGLLIVFVGKTKLILLLYVFLYTDTNKNLVPSLERWAITIFLRVNT